MAAKKLFSLTGVAPVGVFVLLHVVWYARSLSGPQAFRATLIEPGPMLLTLELLFVWLPLAYHGLYGAFLTLTSTRTLGTDAYPRRAVHVLQRVSGLVVFAFIVYHGWQLRAPLALGSMTGDDVLPTLVSTMSSTNQLGIPVVALVYLLGVAATAFHLARGLLAVLSAWSVLQSPRAQRIASGACTLLGIAVFWLAAATIIYLATGSRLVPEMG